MLFLRLWYAFALISISVSCVLHCSWVYILNIIVNSRYVSCLCKSYYMARDPDHYADIAWSLALPYDEEYDYHPQFTGYRRREQIKQADAVLLGFPLQYNMNTLVQFGLFKYL